MQMNLILCFMFRFLLLELRGRQSITSGGTENYFQLQIKGRFIVK